jgi:hypothetical protein
MYAWFLWGQLVFSLLISVVIIVVFAFSTRGIIAFKKSNIIPVFFLLVIQFYVSRDQNTNALLATLLRIIIISIVLLLRNDIKARLFKFLTDAFALLLLVSVIFWFLFLLGIPLPHYQTDFNDNQYIFDNYFLFLYNHADMVLPIPRFSSVFLEPGQLGMITAFFLCANHFELKRKSVLVIFIATILTFSLAAYVLLLISASSYLIFTAKKPLRNLIFWSVFVVSLYTFFINYNNGDNVVNNLLIDRLQLDNYGDIKANNRFSQDMDVYFDRFIDSNDVIYGLGQLGYDKLFLGANAGYKVFVLTQGIVGTFLVFLFYFLVTIGNQSKMGWILFIVYIACFLQAAYPLWESELILFITAMPFLKLDNLKGGKETLFQIRNN